MYLAMGFDDKELLKFAASVERNSQHPLGEALVRKAQAENVELVESQNFDTVGGKGVVATVEGKRVLIGNKAMLKGNGFMISDEYDEKISEFGVAGKTAVLIGIDNEMIGYNCNS